MKVKVAQSCPTLCNPMDCPWNSPGQNTGVGSLSRLQRIFPTQGLNPGLLHCRWILYQLSHKGSPRILEWVLSHVSCVQLCNLWSPPGSSVHGILQARIQEWLPCLLPWDFPDPGIEPRSLTLADVFFTTSATWEASGL